MIGDCPWCEDEGEHESLRLTHGHSTDRRPDLKQFLVKMLCAYRNIPVIGGCKSGNESDKNINNRVLTHPSSYMASHGLVHGAFVCPPSAQIQRVMSGIWIFAKEAAPRL